MDNMQIYNAARSVPVEAQKGFNTGKFAGTDINPMWRIKTLTTLFGPAGVGWYVDDVVERCEIHGETTISIVNLNLYIKVNGEWSKPIFGTGGNVLLRKGSASDEGYKMALTDALSVACKMLGIGADIYFDKDVTKYTEQNITPPGSPEYDPQEKAEGGAPTRNKKTSKKLLCADCGNEITPWIVNGECKMSADDVAKLAEKRYKRQLCIACGAKAKEDAGNAE